MSPFVRSVAVLVLFFVVGPGYLLLAQTNPANKLFADQTPEQLEKTAAAYEQFLREPPPGTAPYSTIEVEAHLGTVYFLLHRYGDSLAVLERIPRGASSSSPDSAHLIPLESETSAPLRAQVSLVIGLDYLELNRLPEALLALRRATEMQPGNATARLALGDALARSNRLEDAVREYERQTRLTPALPDAWYKLGLAHSFIAAPPPVSVQKQPQGLVLRQLETEQLLNEGRYLDCARALFKLVRDAPLQPGVHADLGRALLEIGHPKAAEDQLRKELAIDPSNPSVRLDLAQTAALRGDWDEVAMQLTAVSSQQPRELTRLLQKLPAGLVKQAWTQGSIRIPDEFAITSAGGLWRAWMDQSQLIEVKGSAVSPAPTCPAFSSAVRAPGVWLSEACYRKLTGYLTNNKSASLAEKIKLAEAEFRLGRFSQALRAAQSILEAQHDNEWGIYWFRSAHRGLAEECFLKVADLDPNSVRGHQMLAQAYAAWMEFAKARKEYQTAISLAPGQADLHMGLGTVYWRTNDWPAAEKELKTALDLAPQSALAHYELGDTYLQQGQWQQAYDQLKSVPPEANAIYEATLDLAKAEDELGKTAEAIASLLSVVARDEDGQAHFSLASLYRKSGDNAKAQEALQAFKQLRAASLQADKDEAGILEQERSANAN